MAFTVQFAFLNVVFHRYQERFSVLTCTFDLRTDETCALLPPRRSPEPLALTTGIKTKLVGALCTRFNGTMTNTRAALARATITEWGRLRILPEGDIIRAASFGRSTDQPTTPAKLGRAERDATFVRVC